MAVLNEITVGRIRYQEVDDIPTHSAELGTIAFDKSNGLIFQNISGTSSWSSLMKPAYGRIYYANSAVTTDTNDTNWYYDNTSTYTPDANMFGFTYSTYKLRCNNINAQGKYLILVNATFETTGQLYIVEQAPVINPGGIQPVVIPTTAINSARLGSGTNARCNILTNKIEELRYGDEVVIAKRYATQLGTGGDTGYILKHVTIEVFRASSFYFLNIFTDGFESGTFSNWTTANGATNRWFVGTSETNGGTYSAFITNNNSTATYTATTTQVSHFYRDFTFPNPTEDVLLVFDYKVYGENAAGVTNYDYGAVVIADTTTTPAAGTEVNTALATIVGEGPSGNGRIGATTNSGKFNLAYYTATGTGDSIWRTETLNMNNYKGLTKRLIFTWKNDNITGNNPGFVVDNIRLVKKLYI